MPFHSGRAINFGAGCKRSEKLLAACSESDPASHTFRPQAGILGLLGPTISFAPIPGAWKWVWRVVGYRFLKVRIRTQLRTGKASQCIAAKPISGCHRYQVTGGIKGSLVCRWELKFLGRGRGVLSPPTGAEMRTLGWIVTFIFALVWLTNSCVMLFSPRTWFRLPSWIGLRGSLTEADYGSGWGAVQVRLLGAICLGGFAWVLYDILFGGKW